MDSSNTSVCMSGKHRRSWRAANEWEEAEGEEERFSDWEIKRTEWTPVCTNIHRSLQHQNKRCPHTTSKSESTGFPLPSRLRLPGLCITAPSPHSSLLSWRVWAWKARWAGAVHRWPLQAALRVQLTNSTEVYRGLPACIPTVPHPFPSLLSLPRYYPVGLKHSQLQVVLLAKPAPLWPLPAESPCINLVLKFSLRTSTCPRKPPLTFSCIWLYYSEYMAE